MNIENILINAVKNAVKSFYSAELNDNFIQIQETKKEFSGDLTLVIFPLLKISRKSPEATGEDIGKYLVSNLPEVKQFSIVKGFLNLEISDDFWLSYLNKLYHTHDFSVIHPTEKSRKILVEYSSPNTNKPLHLGHVRNNLLGFSISNILKANGHEVVMVNLVNDRGIHICKSMLAWQKWGNNETPESSGIKGDHLVGNYYVRFDQEYKKEVSKLVLDGISQIEAEKKAPLLLEAQHLLRQWENKDDSVRILWNKMNAWVYKGFDETYKKLGVKFDKIYYESETYLSGKEIVKDGIDNGIFIKKEDQSVWVDLTDIGLDQKLLLRSDGTSVYITQDLGTACQRFEEYKADEMVYVVGNEQIYHFQVLSGILLKLGYDWASKLQHMSYGMVELPNGKMKSREGTVVDADDLVEEMIENARIMSAELGKLEGYTEQQAEDTYRMIGMGALKYYILKVDPRKNMLFDPKESIDFNGNTGPFIQYTFTRIRSIMRKANEANIILPEQIELSYLLEAKEKELLKLLYKFSNIVLEAGKLLSPALIANYVYELAREYNQFYHECPILKEEDILKRNMRLILCYVTGDIIRVSMGLLGIEVPERM